MWYQVLASQDPPPVGAEGCLPRLNGCVACRCGAEPLADVHMKRRRKALHAAIRLVQLDCVFVLHNRQRQMLLWFAAANQQMLHLRLKSALTMDSILGMPEL